MKIRLLNKELDKKNWYHSKNCWVFDLLQFLKL